VRDEPGEPTNGGRGAEPELLTFLIADVRGYTRFTQDHGDEEGAKVAARFAELARESITELGGRLIELRGDEALAFFGSARQAIRAAVGLQSRFRERVDGEPVFPLAIGIGLDAGEAVPIEGGFRGGPLNLAARLCSLAAPGQILASETVTSLARRVDGIRFVPRRPVRLKGLERPVRAIEVVPETPLPPFPQAAAVRRRLTPARLALLAAAATAIAGAVVGLMISRSNGSEGLARISENAAGLIDPDGNRISAEVALGRGPTAIAVGGGSVWVGNSLDGTISRIDANTRQVTTIDAGGEPVGLAFGEGSLWVTTVPGRSVSQIDPGRNRLLRRFEIGNGPRGVAVGFGDVWIATALDGALVRLDLATGAVVKRIPVGPNPTGVATGGNAVWVTSEDSGTVVRIEPRSGTVQKPINVGNGPGAVAVGAGAVWVANRRDDTVSRVDPATDSVTETIGVGKTPSAVAIGAGAVWVANSGDGTVSRIDPETRQRVETIEVSGSPSALAIAAGSVWATTLASASSHRGGTLRIAQDPFCRCFDPAAFDPILPLLYDGLVAYRYVGGAGGGTLVGNLAADVPKPSDDGKTYVFKLRPNIRYSNGTRLRPRDFRSSIERVFRIAPQDAAQFYGGIVGANRCVAKPATCDLRRGIETNEQTGTITIRLRAPNGAFLHALTARLAYVVPRGSPPHLARKPLAGTGPYRVASFDPDSGARLVRNPHFRPRSEARPDGFPDEILVQTSDDVAAQVAAVERGEADLAVVSNPFGSLLSPARIHGLAARHASRIHTGTLPQLDFVLLNVRTPPFDDVRVRRALNYAVDRAKVVDLAGGPELAQPTCQFLPPGFAAYAPYCPYTRGPRRGGVWTAPDLVKARALVAQSGTRGMKVEVWAAGESAGSAPSAGVAIGRYLVSLLRQLGYRSSLRRFPDFEQYLRALTASPGRAQAGPIGWLFNDAAPSDFIQTNFACRQFGNFSQFCDRAIDARISQAVAAQASDPAASNRLWQRLDRELVDAAPAVPLVNRRMVVLVSERVGNFQHHPLLGPLLDQLWVK
jgi:YVTN family beta-propeller protein